jgi:hypothetical protein
LTRTAHKDQGQSRGERFRFNFAARLCIALVHYPVKGRNGETIASAITNLDIHDIARAARTYGVEKFYVVTPLQDQKALAEKIVSHWQTGAGAEYNPDRGKAFELVRVVSDIREVTADIGQQGEAEIRIVATSAIRHQRNIGFQAFREVYEKPENEHVVFLVVLGTAWGLADELMEGADYVLAPIRAGSEYNHLSVRSAAAIILDRILGGCGNL